MKSTFAKASSFVLTSAAVLLASCASAPVKIFDPVGPASSSVAKSVTEGELIVHSTPYRDPDLDYGPLETSYTVSDLRGRRIERVTNPGAHVEHVAIPAGWYLVGGAGRGMDRVQVEVEIVPGKVTEVFLDPAQIPPTLQAAKYAVRGPDGAFVGWRADKTPSEKFVAAPHGPCPGSC